MIEVLAAQGVYKSFDLLGEQLHVLQGVDLKVGRGESVAVMGPSGSGKTTLLSIVGGLLKPDKGQIVLDGVEIYNCPEAERDKVRNRTVGFIFQFHHLAPELTAIENAAVPRWIRGDNWENARDHVEELLRKLGLGNRLESKPYQLSGGERQRVALARAVAAEPMLVVSDEPTGNLDRANALRVQDLLLGLLKSRDIGILVATHNEEFAKSMDRVLVLSEGQIQAE